MTLETWLAFALASTILVLIPGPTVLLVISYALGQGWRSALPTAIGVALGDFTAMTLSMLGLGAVLQASALLYLALKWIGGRAALCMSRPAKKRPCRAKCWPMRGL
jgi:threonine/homoserine/homoserine lactone efflux protein